MKEVNEEHKKNQDKDRKRELGSAVIGGLIGAGIVGGISYANTKDNVSQEELNQAVSQAVTNQVQNGQKNGKAVYSGSVQVSSDVTKIYKKVGGAVVSVLNLEDTSNSQVYDLFGFQLPSQKSDNNNKDKYKTASSGSGVIYKVDGDKAYIVTNNHVIKNSDKLAVVLENGTQVPVELVGADVWTDLAVLTMPAKYASTVAKFGDSSTLQVGEPAVAIGSPMGEEFASSVTAGIISGLNRQVPTDLDGDGTSDWTVNAIQTDAAINPGNSGGALVNAAGQVIGINSMKMSSSSVEGMGFAIPSNDVKTIIAQLEQNGKVIRPTLGVQMSNLYQFSPEQRKEVLKLPEDVKEGAVIMQVSKGSPAEEAGLHQYDVVTEFNGKKVANATDLRQALYSSDVNAKVKVEFYRNGKKQTTEVQLRPQDDSDIKS